MFLEHIAIGLPLGEELWLGDVQSCFVEDKR
jgi:hypothetical protein